MYVVDVEVRSLKYKKRKNRGSATIEMTLLMPVILGVIYLYISFFIFFVDSAVDMEDMAVELYIQKEEKGNNEKKKMLSAGSKKSVYINEKSGLFNKSLELHRYSDSAVENIRRWQLATDTILSRGNP